MNVLVNWKSRKHGPLVALHALDGPILQTKHYLLSLLYTSMLFLSFLCLGYHLPGTPLSPFTFDNFPEFMRLLSSPLGFCPFSDKYWQWNPSKGRQLIPLWSQVWQVEIVGRGVYIILKGQCQLITTTGWGKAGWPFGHCHNKRERIRKYVHNDEIDRLLYRKIHAPGHVLFSRSLEPANAPSKYMSHSSTFGLPASFL